jgi:hypothetical protein
MMAKTGLLDSLHRGRCCHASHEGYSTGVCFQNNFHDSSPLRPIQVGKLAGAAKWGETMHTRTHQMVNQATQLIIHNISFGINRRY